jgi:alanine-glyoxylate transaminase/serine-glyoxylate transaminase/serine-pyruvate transaminase
LGQLAPIMEAYEARKPSYFGTPAVNLVAALTVSLVKSERRTDAR